MGRPYGSEIEALADTYAWALARDVGDLRSAVRASSSLPALAVGSGGSLTTAHVLARLHETVTGRVARHTTPLDLISHRFLDREIGMWILTAGGSNPDVLAAFDAALHQEPRHLAVLCARMGSQLRDRAERHAHARVFELDLPAGRDGFLATNSLLASVTVLARAYGEALVPCEELPPDPMDLLPDVHGTGDLLSGLRPVLRHLWDRETLLVLHSLRTSAAAVDLESKFTEAALGHIQVADYRNLGHGRHVWLARRGGETGVLALETDTDADLVERTLRLLPDEVAVARLKVADGLTCSPVASVLASILVTGLAGEGRGIDPGRPTVPRFGRQLYRLSPGRIGTRRTDGNGVPLAEATAIQRKAGASVDILQCRGQLETWRRAYFAFRTELEHARFAGIVVDYDGTLVDEVHRWDPPRKDVADELRRFLSDGFNVGVATGRGDSVRTDLQAILPRELWPGVLVGYYNGGDVGALDDEAHPDRSEARSDELCRVAELVQSDAFLRATCACRPRRWQVTVEPEMRDLIARVWERVHHLVRAGGLDVRVLRSGHSVDVIPGHVTKRGLVDQMRRRIPDGRSVLCIGDMGCWPGNDFALLDDPHGLSVDDVSADPATCWNLSPRGARGVRAILSYFNALARAGDGGGPFTRRFAAPLRRNDCPAISSC